MAKDIYHKIVKEALEKDGWIITHDPYKITIFGSPHEADLGAEKLFAAEKESKKIVIEIKSFISPSFTYEFHGALGQYINYRDLLEEQDPNRILFLAVNENIYDNFFSRPATDYVVKKEKMKIVVFNHETITIEKWIEI
jgi:hypothetical protein